MNGKQQGGAPREAQPDGGSGRGGHRYTNADWRTEKIQTKEMRGNKTQIEKIKKKQKNCREKKQINGIRMKKI